MKAKKPIKQVRFEDPTTAQVVFKVSLPKKYREDKEYEIRKDMRHHPAEG